MKKYAIFLLCIFIITCGRWKITKLKPYTLCTINSGESPGKILLKYDGNDILDISFKIQVYGNNIYTSDNILKRVQVLDRNGEPEFYFGDKKWTSDDKSNIRFSKFLFSIIDTIAVDSNGNLYIQNSIVSSNKSDKNLYEKDIGFSPSYILVFNEKGTLIYTLGKTGSPEIPFNSIESLKIDKNDRLFVISRSYDTWSASRFIDKTRNFNVNFSEIDFKETDREDTLSGKIEKIIAYDSGDDLIISVAYYNKIDFKYRKLFHYSIQKEKIDSTILEIPDPKNELFTIIDDKLIYLWDIDNSDLRFMIINFERDIVNNISIKFPDMNNSFNEILIDNTGQFYSYHVIKEGIKLIEWK